MAKTMSDAAKQVREAGFDSKTRATACSEAVDRLDSLVGSAWFRSYFYPRCNTGGWGSFTYSIPSCHYGLPWMSKEASGLEEDLGLTQDQTHELVAKLKAAEDVFGALCSPGEKGTLVEVNPNGQPSFQLDDYEYAFFQKAVFSDPAGRSLADIPSDYYGPMVCQDDKGNSLYTNVCQPGTKNCGGKHACYAKRASPETVIAAAESLLVDPDNGIEAQIEGVIEAACPAPEAP